MNIYVVIGMCGEWSDHREWPIAAYDNEALAQEHVLLAADRERVLRAEARAAGIEDPSFNWIRFHEWLKENGKVNEYDPEMDLDYTGVRYNYIAVPLRKRVAPMEAKKEAET